MKGPREIFLNAYANLPSAARREIIVVIENSGVKSPYSWDAAFFEVSQNSETGKEIVKALSENPIFQS